MHKLFQVLILGLLISLGFSACKKAEENVAGQAKEVIEEVKENTLDAAKDAVTATEKAAKDTAETIDQAVNDINSKAEDAEPANKDEAPAK